MFFLMLVNIYRAEANNKSRSLLLRFRKRQIETFV
ncbi:hypothetical protein SHPE106448_03135 [Shewanella pealeana]